MANTYLQFSLIIPNITEDEKAWLKQAVAYLDGEEGFEPTEDSPFEDILDGEEVSCNAMRFDPDGFWIYAEESGSPDEAARFIQMFLSKFRPTDAIGFEWAITCDKPRPDGFGGGAIVVTATEQKWMNSTQWLIENMPKKEA